MAESARRSRAPSAVLVSVVARRLLVAHTRVALSSIGIAGTSRRKGADLISHRGTDDRT